MSGTIAATHRLFVYGTLKRGACNHHYLAGQTFVGPAATVAGYTLYALDGYPGMVADSTDQTGVTGEIWAVDPCCLTALDELEGVHENLYRRVPVPLSHPAAAGPVETYLYAQSIAGRSPLGSTWPVTR